MATKQISGEAFASNLAGLSKTQLYDIMSQMKTLIEQNPEQAREILIQNPPLTRALFQAQIMLGMVQPPKPAQPSKQTQPSAQATSTHGSQLLPGQGGMHEATNVVQAQNPIRRQQQNQPPGLIPSTTPIPGVHAQLSQQHRTQVNVQMPLSQSSQVTEMSSLSHLHSSASGQLQQPLQTPGSSHMPLQPPLTQTRPNSAPLSHQFQSAMGSNMTFQHPGAQQMHHLQPLYNPNVKPPSSGVMGPPFPHGQQFPNQHQSSQYQGGNPHAGADFNSRGSSMQVERGGAQWQMGPPVGGSQLPGPPPMPPSHMGNQPAGVAPMTPDMEQMLQQVMRLTPEQINELSPEQRSHVLQLRQLFGQ